MHLESKWYIMREITERVIYNVSVLCLICFERMWMHKCMHKYMSNCVLWLVYGLFSNNYTVTSLPNSSVCFILSQMYNTYAICSGYITCMCMYTECSCMPYVCIQHALVCPMYVYSMLLYSCMPYVCTQHALVCRMYTACSCMPYVYSILLYALCAHTVCSA